MLPFIVGSCQWGFGSGFEISTLETIDKEEMGLPPVDRSRRTLNQWLHPLPGFPGDVPPRMGSSANQALHRKEVLEKLGTGINPGEHARGKEAADVSPRVGHQSPWGQPQVQQ